MRRLTLKQRQALAWLAARGDEGQVLAGPSPFRGDTWHALCRHELIDLFRQPGPGRACTRPLVWRITDKGRAALEADRDPE